AYAQQNIVIKFGAHVLHLRGLETQSQPIVDKESKDVLCWNGEVFGGLDIGSNNDGLLLFEKIQQTKQEDPATYILRVFKNIEGPYAFVYLDYKQRKLWFARDFLGRRSLLTKRAGKNSLLISSVADSVSSAAEEQNTTELVLPFDQVTLNLAEHCLPAQAAESISDLADFPKTAQWQPYINQLKAVLMQAIRTRVEYIPFNHSSTETSSQPRVGILFSGGVDCITIAALLTKILPKTEPIELFNVAFENPRQAKAHKPLDLSKSNIYDVPDRKTGRQGWQELCQLDPERDWRFVEVDVPYSLVVENKTNIRQLLVPSDTIMDMSIGLALWFASKGEGYLVNKDASNGLGYSRQPYTGVARVLLLGMGADEQLGGYSRHRAAWERGGWQELGQEIRLDVQRISTRNLGRDDRMVSDNSKESRYPFIAAEVVKFLSETPLDRKMDMHYPRGIGEKLLLRLLAHQLGLLQACMLAKRAIQFGARTAKME
ncbi:asparagine synthase-domain-containing protein, partial [Coemansia spiralis]